jgi:hypothetical protein
MGTSEWSGANDQNYPQTRAHVAGWLNITSASVYFLQHYASRSQATNGFGVDTFDGTTNVYTVMKITRQSVP